MRENQAERVPRKLSGLSVGTHNYSCGRTESVHLPEMKEKTTIIALVMTSGWEQRKRAFYLRHFPVRMFPHSTTCYMRHWSKMPQTIPESKA